MANVTIDTPDYQRGIVNAQKLLASVPSGTEEVRVGVPPNAETLIVTFGAEATVGTISVTGFTTGTHYTVVRALAGAQWEGAPTFFVDCSSSLDAEVRVAVQQATGGEWWVYGDAGVHLVADVAAAHDSTGTAYVTTVPPSTASKQHPPTELQAYGGVVEADGVVLAAPGAGKRYRLFNALLVPDTPELRAHLYDSVSGVWLSVVSNLGVGNVHYGPSGYPMGGDAAVGYYKEAGNGYCLIHLAYTTETV